jgi:hypothetical protein
MTPVSDPEVERVCSKAAFLPNGAGLQDDSLFIEGSNLVINIGKVLPVRMW